MAQGRAWGRVSALLSIVGGAVLLLLVLAEAKPPTEPVIPLEKAEQIEPEPPQQTEDQETEPVNLAAVMLPPPPMPDVAEPVPEVKPDPKPEPVPEPAVEAAPSPPKPEPEPAHEIKPLKAEVVEPKPVAPPEPEPVHEIKPLKAEAPKPKPVEPAKPLKPVARKWEPAPEPEPELRVKPLQPREPEPKPEPVEEIVVERERAMEPLRPRPRPEPAAQPTERRPEPKPETVEVSVTASGEVAREGRALLRLLEHGSGPTIEIGWPRDSRQRHNLYRTLSSCFGMKPILMDGSGNLYSQEGGRGKKWEINLDRFSGFVRQPAGFVATEERRAADTIRRYHGLRIRTNIVRIFPRRVDAVLLGGLQQILGDGYGRSRAIHGTYRQIGGTLYVEDIVADGVSVAGRIAFSSGRRCNI